MEKALLDGSAFSFKGWGYTATRSRPAAAPVHLMLRDKSSYVRTRGFILICNQAQWVNDGQMEEVFDQMLSMLNDPKPTVVRQCLNALHEVALFQPELSERIENALDEMELSKYKDSIVAFEP